MEGELFGLTPEQRFYIDRAAAAAADAAIEKMAGKPCPFVCDDVDTLKATVYGNGTDGLKGQLTRLQTEMEDVVWAKRASIIAAFGAGASLIVALIK